MSNINKATYKRFFRYLQVNHPLNHDLNIDLNLTKEAVTSKDNAPCYGLVRYNSTDAKITVNLSASPLLNLKVIAHEYRHLLQRFNMGWDDTSHTDHAHEMDAQFFGKEQAWKYAREVIKIC